MPSRILVEPERRSPRIAALKAAKAAKSPAVVVTSVVELDDFFEESRVIPKLVRTVWGLFGVVRRRRDQRVDDYETTEFLVEWIDWQWSTEAESVRLNSESEWLESDDFEQLGYHRTDTETYYHIEAVKKRSVAKMVRAQHLNMQHTVKSQGKFTIVRLGAHIAKSYKHPRDCGKVHHYFYRKVDCTKAMLDYVVTHIRERVGDCHEGFEFLTRGPNKGRFKCLKLRNEGVAKLFGDKCAVRRFNSTWLCVFNMLIMWKKLSKVPTLVARYDIFHRDAAGTRMGVNHIDPRF